jgi:hypothetical protein
VTNRAGDAYNTDHGLGLCLACLNERIAAERDLAAARAKDASAKQREPLPAVRWAITMAPALVPVPGPLQMMLVPQPSCYVHLVPITPEPPPGSGLLLPGRVN